MRTSAALLLAGVVTIGLAGPDQRIDVTRLAFAPGIDGDLQEWRVLEPSRIAIAPAVEGDERNRTGSIEVELWAGRSETDIYVAARWPDSTADTDFRPGNGAAASIAAANSATICSPCGLHCPASTTAR